MDIVSGYNVALNRHVGSLGFDKQNRIWALNNFDGTSEETGQFFELDSNLNFQQSLKFYNAMWFWRDLPAARLDTSTGRMYLLHFNSSNALSVYEYDSNF